MKKGKNEKWLCKDINEVKEAFHGITSIVASDTRFMAQALMFIAERLEVIPTKTKRKPTEWQKFFAKGMREGKSPTEIATAWKSKSK